MSVRLRVILTLALAASLLTQFNNCAEPLPDIQQYSTQSSTVTFNVSLSTPAVYVNQTSQVLIEGGTAPYTYKVTSGSASVTNDGLITGLAVGAITIEVKDSAGNIGYVSLTVNAAAVKLSCTTPWGQVVSDGSQATGYERETETCPNTCMAQTYTCNNGSWSSTFTATKSSCSVTACKYTLASALLSGSALIICQTNYPVYTEIPASCSSADYNKYICYIKAGLGAALWRCSAP